MNTLSSIDALRAVCSWIALDVAVALIVLNRLLAIVTSRHEVPVPVKSTAAVSTMLFVNDTSDVRGKLVSLPSWSGEPVVSLKPSIDTVWLPLRTRNALSVEAAVATIVSAPREPVFGLMP